MTLNAVTVVGKPDKATMNRYNCEIMVDFTTTNPINIGGTVEIRFPTSITNLSTNCRSAVSAGSLLYSQGGAFG
jgi:hypothetical protein